MAVREIVDSGGRVWKVWPVTPDQLQPRTAAEDYLGDFGEGWLCFESASERRRLAGIPGDWEQLSDADLAALLDQAEVVKQRRRFGLDQATSELGIDHGPAPTNGEAGKPV